jgi:small subunit ribosomal protein S6
MIKVYEFVCLVSPDLSEHDLRVSQETLEALVKKHKGKVVTSEVWGKRPLAYTIKKQDSANYIFFVIELDTTNVLAFDRDVRLDTKIMRHLLVIQDKFLKQAQEKKDVVPVVEKAA